MRLVSIYGDSISTYEGYNPQGYSVFYNMEMQKRNGLNSVYDTWWAKVNQALRAYLCVNNSYSGSCVSGAGFPSGICDDRLNCLRTSNYTPDIILVYLGFNDFGNGVRVYSSKINALNGAVSSCFHNAYSYMVKSLCLKYPHARIVCGTLMRTFIRNWPDWTFPERYRGIALEDYNDAIRSAVRKNRCYLADLSALKKHYETVDGTHPTAVGHQTIADSWINCLMQLDLMTPNN